MPTSAQRLGRLGSPNQRPTALRTPTCQQCTTDYYLKFMAIVPTGIATAAAPERRSGLTAFRTLLNKLRHGARTVASGGHVKYFCQKCGTFHHHEFPQGWEPTTREPSPSDFEQLPTLYVGPGESRQARDINEVMVRVRQRRSVAS
ncbi:hypothetical protein [Kocuria sp.]|uniref:hypothetical protein n=1 Tax=Kocuria sp. TaxID=1871328 RepID=UPI0026DEDC25|nr:hypothetical protein [Kocuria sp.]MDO5618941.1 hypothetical protein [Kocuria sp.]